MESRPVDQIVLDRVLNEHTPPPNSKSLEDVASTVAGVLGVGIEALRGRSKARILILGRLLAYYLLRRLGLGSAGEIGTYFGGRSHSTIIHGEKQVRARLDHSQELPDDWPKGWKGMLERIEQMLAR
jgi:chromosomal replication initiator protein